MIEVFLVGDGFTDIYGIFSTRALAEAWIQRQKDRRYRFADCLEISPWPLDVANDLGN